MTLNLISICSFTIQAIQIMPFYTYYTHTHIGKKDNGRKRSREWAEGRGGGRMKNQQKNREGSKVRNKGTFSIVLLCSCVLPFGGAIQFVCSSVRVCVFVFIPVLSHFSIAPLYIFGLDERKTKYRDWKKFTFMV